MTPVFSQLVTTLQLVISGATVATIIYAFVKFTKAPNKTQDERLDALEAWKEKVDGRLREGDDRFEQVDKGNRITQKALLALMKHAINGNDVDSLKDAEKSLEEYLVEK